MQVGEVGASRREVGCEEIRERSRNAMPEVLLVGGEHAELGEKSSEEDVVRQVVRISRREVGQAEDGKKQEYLLVRGEHAALCEKRSEEKG